MKLKILYENDNLLVIDKPADITIFSEKQGAEEKTLTSCILERFPYLRKVGSLPRYGIIHRLDKETSGILLVAKNQKSIKFFQKQFKERRVVKKYLALVVGNVKLNQEKIDTLMARAPKNRIRQKVYLPHTPSAQRKKLRKAITEYKVKKRFKNYTLLEITPKTGRKHQIRCHMFHIYHPIAGDKLYGFKNQPTPKNLNRQFLHAVYIKIKLANGKEKEIKSPLPKDLKNVLEKINHD